MLRIGEFSKIAQVPSSQLRYYDEIDLLKPVEIDKFTGYRYYSLDQLPDLNRILALKELDLSLEQITRMVNDNLSADEIRGMLALKKLQVEQALREEALRLHLIESRLRQIEDHGRFDMYDIVTKQLPAQPFIGFRKLLPDFGAATQFIGEMQRALPSRISNKKLGYLTAILHSEHFDVADIDIEMGFPLQTEFDGEIPLSNNVIMQVGMLPAVDMMVTVTRTGLPQTASHCRSAVAHWVESNGYEFYGNGREVFLVPPRPGKEKETVLEIQYPVRPAGSPHPLAA